MATQSRKQDYISEARDAARQLWDAYLKLQSLQSEWNGQDYANTLAEGFEDAQGNPNAHTGLTQANIGAVVHDTADAVEALMNTGHATNITNIL